MPHRGRTTEAGLSSSSQRLIAIVAAFAMLLVANAAQAKTFAWKATGRGGTIVACAFEDSSSPSVHVSQ